MDNRVTVELCDRTAVDLAGLLRRREVSAVEVLESHLRRIEAVNPAVNAVVTLDVTAARRTAQALDRLAPGEPLGRLHGLPIAVKDLEDTAGLRTTYGSPVFRDHVPTRDTLVVARLRAAGAVIVGKTNTPEFGVGSQTFNTVFGATRNPYDLTRTPGGSSGGAAAAVAVGMLPFADGSDFAASIRNPAAFCNLVGVRPTAGRVPDVPAARPWDPLAVLGPLARTVADAALLLQAMSGPDPRAPLSRLDAPASFTDLDSDPAGMRIAWSERLGDLPVDPEVTEALVGARRALASMGCVVDDVEPDLSGADEAFEVLRAVGFAQAFAELLRTHPDELKDTLVANTRRGLAVTGAEVADALTAQATTFQGMRSLLERYDALALPTSQVTPFPTDQEWVREIAGVPMRSYLEWMRSCSRISVTAHPAVSVPGGFTPDGLPVGLQLVGRHGDELGLLRLAAAFEAATGTGRRRPPVISIGS
jgi:amidase